MNEVPPEGVTDASQWSFRGSTLVMVAESAEACRDILRQDIYATSGVWDVDNAQIMPVSFRLINESPWSHPGLLPQFFPSSSSFPSS